MLFQDEFSIGTSRLPLLRQSATAKFRNYAENSRWEVGGVMFATINLPANNNHYRLEAGRNSEFEDRLIATRDWLHHLAVHASISRVDAIVLFSDRNPIAPPRRGIKRDGFKEARQQISSLAAKFPGRVLLVHGQPTETAPGQGIG